MKSRSLQTVLFSLFALILTACTNPNTQIPEPSAAERTQIEDIVIQTKRVDIATHLVQVFRPDNQDITPDLWNTKIAALQNMDPVVQVLTQSESELNYPDELTIKLKNLSIHETLDAVAVIESDPKGFAIIRRIADQDNEAVYQILFWSENKLRQTVRNLDLNDSL